MRSRLLVTGGVQFKDALNRPQGQRFQLARVVDVNLEDGTAEAVIEYSCNGNNYPDEGGNSIFLAGEREGDHLYLCTGTEVLEYGYPSMDLVRSASYPFFQDIHHVKPIGDRLAVVSTGLDLVVFLDRRTLEPIEYFNTLGKDPWHRHSRDVDHRKFVSLKPHESHPNYVFELDGAVWVTRLMQKDAVSLGDSGRRIDVQVERPHDGCVSGDGVYFTTVNGYIVKVNSETKEREYVLDLNELEKAKGPLGWCRGLLVEDSLAYVGFTRLRDTPIKENVRWVARFLTTTPPRDTHLAVYDLRKREKLLEVDLARNISAVYSIIVP